MFDPHEDDLLGFEADAQSTSQMSYIPEEEQDSLSIGRNEAGAPSSLRPKESKKEEAKVKKRKNLHRIAERALIIAKRPDGGSNYASAKAPQFFKVILSSEPRLRLPSKFVKKYGGSLPYLVSLEAPTGPIFQVELARSNGDICFEKGFQDFLDYYSIGFDYLLVFTYSEDFYFHVAIFDTNAMEIEYPYTATTEKRDRFIQMFEKSSPIEEEGEIHSDDSVEVLASVPIRRRGKRREQNAAKEDQNTYTGHHLRHRISGSAQEMKAKEEVVAYQNAKAFKSRNPSFISFMLPSYVCRPFVLTIPKSFAEKYLPCRNSDLVLCDSGGRTWKVKLHVANLSKRLYWKNFVEDNGLQVGDACVFECPKNTKGSTLNVIIFKNN